MPVIYPPTTVVSTEFFYNASVALFNPTTVTCTITSPSGTKKVYTFGMDSNVANPSVGKFTCTYLQDAGGSWKEVWQGTTDSGKITDVRHTDATSYS